MSETFYDASNLSISNGFGRNRDRYYLEEYFDKLPYVNGLKHSAIVARGTVNTNTTSEEALVSATIPADSLVVGDVIHIVGMAQAISTNSSDTSTIKLRLGVTSAIAGTTIATSAALNVDNDDDVYIDMYVTIRTVGSSGTMVGHGQIRTDDAGGTLLNIILASTAINTTVANYIGFTNTWSVASGSNQMAADSFIVDITHLDEHVPNTHFEILGEDATSTNVTFSSTESGITLTTTGGDDDQVIVLPHLDTNQSAWTGIKWGTENQVEWECALRTGDTADSVTAASFWAGLKLTNVGTYATNDDQAYFLYAADDDQGALTTNANLHFVYSVADTDYITNLGIAVAQNTTYKLRISIDSDRKVSVFVGSTNSSGTITPMTQYGLVTSATAGGATQSTVSTKSAALTNDINLIPYVGVQDHAGAVKKITLCYEKVSRTLFE